MPSCPPPLKKNQTNQTNGRGETKVPQVHVSVPIYYLLSSVNERAQLLQGGGITLLCWPQFPQIVINHSQSTCHRQAEIQLELGVGGKEREKEEEKYIIINLRSDPRGYPHVSTRGSPSKAAQDQHCCSQHTGGREGFFFLQEGGGHQGNLAV